MSLFAVQSSLYVNSLSLASTLSGTVQILAQIEQAQAILPELATDPARATELQETIHPLTEVPPIQDQAIEAERLAAGYGETPEPEQESVRGQIGGLLSEMHGVISTDGSEGRPTAEEVKRYLEALGDRDLVLTANRGVPGSRAAAELHALELDAGIVYSNPDFGSDAVRFSDFMAALQGSTSAETYLDHAKVIRAAQAVGLGARGVYPGYGFLAEDGDFAQKVQDAGLIWFGPEPDVIKRLGSKQQAMEVAEQAGVPVAATSPILRKVSEAHAQADEIGFPLMVKADKGGGGRGVIRVDDHAALDKAFADAADLGQSGFGNPDVTLMKYMQRPRHFEVQIFGLPPNAKGERGADPGFTAKDLVSELPRYLESPEGMAMLRDKIRQVSEHLGIYALEEPRECSVQNQRKQKIVEETGNGTPIEELQKLQLQVWALAVAERVRYTGLGTVEFLYSPVSDEWTFLEVNTRGQVEIGTTERLYGINLIGELFRTFLGREPAIDFGRASPEGHVIELRINAEDSDALTPTAGRFVHLDWGLIPGVEVYSSVSNGSTVNPQADSNVALVVIRGKDRQEALARSREFLCRTTYVGSGGLKLNIPFLLRLLDDPLFVRGAMTDWDIEKVGREFLDHVRPPKPDRSRAIVSAAVMRYLKEREDRAMHDVGNLHLRKTDLRPRDIPPPGPVSYRIQVEGQQVNVSVSLLAPHQLRVDVGDNRYYMRCDFNARGSPLNTLYIATGKTDGGELAEVPIPSTVHLDGDRIFVLIDGETYEGRFISAETAGVDPNVYAQTPGTVTEVNVKEGDTVSRGQNLAEMEAMKMKIPLNAPVSGVVREVRIEVGHAVQADPNAPLIIIEPESAGGSASTSEGEEGFSLRVPSTVPLYSVGPGRLAEDIMVPLHNALVGFDGAGIASERDVLFDRLSSLQAYLNGGPEGTSKKELLAELRNFVRSYQAVSQLASRGALYDAFVRFLRNMDRLSEPSHYPSPELAQTLIQLMRAYRFQIPPEEEIVSPSETLVRIVAASPQGIRYFCYRLLGAILHSEDVRCEMVIAAIKAGAEFWDKDSAPLWQELVEQESSDSPVAATALAALEKVDPRAYHRAQGLPLDPRYADFLQRRRDDPLSGFKRGEVDVMRASLERTPSDRPFDRLPPVIERSEMARFEETFHITPLHSTYQDVFIWRLASKEQEGDVRYLVTGAYNHGIRFQRSEADGQEIVGEPDLEGLMIKVSHVLGAYQKLEPREMNRALIFATQEPIWYLDKPRSGRQYRNDTAFLNRQAIQRIGERVGLFFHQGGLEETRIFVDLKQPTGRVYSPFSNPNEFPRIPARRRIVRVILLGGRTLDMRFDVPADEPVRALSREDLARRSQTQKGKLHVATRFNRLFGRDRWEEIFYTEEGFEAGHTTADEGELKGKTYPIAVAGVRGTLPDGSPCYAVATDFTRVAGSVSLAEGEKIAAMIRRACEEANGLPIVFIVDSAGARIFAGSAGLDGAAAGMRETLDARTRVPQISIIGGPAAGYMAYFPSIARGWVIFVKGKVRDQSTGQMFLTGPDTVREETGIDMTASRLGGAETHTEQTGVGDIWVETEDQAYELTQSLVAYYSGQSFEVPHFFRDAASVVMGKGPFNAFEAAEQFFDKGQFFPMKPSYGHDVTTCLGRKEGQNVGLITVSPLRRGVLERTALRKVIDFIEHCRDRDIPIVIDQRGYFRFGDSDGQALTARLRAIAEQGLADYGRGPTRLPNVTILHPISGSFRREDASPFVDFRIAVAPDSLLEGERARAGELADFVVSSNAEASELLSQLYYLFGNRETPSSDPSDRDTGEIYDIVLSNDPKQAYDPRLLLEGTPERLFRAVAQDEEKARELAQQVLNIQEIETPLTLSETLSIDTDTLRASLSLDKAGEGVALRLEWREKIRTTHIVPEGTSLSTWLSQHIVRLGLLVPEGVDVRDEPYVLLDNADYTITMSIANGSNGRIEVTLSHLGPYRGLLDIDSPFIEVGRGFAGNLVTGYGRIGGRLVHILANDRRNKAGVLDMPASLKGARFIGMNGQDRLSVPFVNQVDVPGFIPGDEEIIDFGGRFLTAARETEVPGVVLETGNSMGGAYIAEHSRFLRGVMIGDTYFPFGVHLALEDARIAVMGSKQGWRFDERRFRTSVDARDLAQAQAAMDAYERRYYPPRRAIAEQSVERVAQRVTARADVIEGLAESGRRVAQIRDLRILHEQGGQVIAALQNLLPEGMAGPVVSMLAGMQGFVSGALPDTRPLDAERAMTGSLRDLVGDRGYWDQLHSGLLSGDADRIRRAVAALAWLPAEMTASVVSEAETAYDGQDELLVLLQPLKVT